MRLFTVVAADAISDGEEVTTSSRNFWEVFVNSGYELNRKQYGALLILAQLGA